MSHSLPDWLATTPATSVSPITDHCSPITSTTPATRAQAIAAMSGPLLHFLPPYQARLVTSLMRGEECQFFYDKMVELARIVEAMPHTYGQQDAEDPIAHLHYFYGGMHWHITEKDIGDDDDEIKGQQHQAFGLCKIHEEELGYVSLPELFAAGRVELDFHFTPKPLSEIRTA